MESNIYTVNGREFELQHFGVKGMKWGRRKARPQPVGTGRRGAKTATDSSEAQAAAKEARRVKAKRAAMVGAAAITTGLAVYGAYKVSKAVKDKRYQRGAEAIARMQKLEAARQKQHQAIVADMMRNSAHGSYSFGGNDYRW